MGYPNPFLEGIPSRGTDRADGSGKRADLIGRFLQDYDSENTRRAYQNDLTGFFGEEASREEVQEVEITGVRRYLRKEAAKVGSQTLRRRASTLSKFFKWLLEEELIEENPLAEVEGPRALAREAESAKEGESAREAERAEATGGEEAGTDRRASSPGQEREETTPPEETEEPGGAKVSEEAKKPAKPKAQEEALEKTEEPGEKEKAEDPGEEGPTKAPPSEGRPLEASPIEVPPLEGRPSQDRPDGPPEREEEGPGERSAEEEAGTEAAEKPGGRQEPGEGQEPGGGQPGDILQPMIEAGLHPDPDPASGSGSASAEDPSSEGPALEADFSEDLLRVPTWAEADLEVHIGWIYRFRGEAFEEGLEVQLRSLPGAIVQGLKLLGDRDRFPGGAIERPYYRIMAASGEWMVTIWRTGEEGAAGESDSSPQGAATPTGLATRLTFAMPLLEAERELENAEGGEASKEEAAGPSALSPKGEAARLLWVLQGRGWALPDLHNRILREALGTFRVPSGPEPERGPTKRFHMGSLAPRGEVREKMALEVTTLLAKGFGLSKTDEVQVDRAAF